MAHRSWGYRLSACSLLLGWLLACGGTSSDGDASEAGAGSGPQATGGAEAGGPGTGGRQVGEGGEATSAGAPDAGATAGGEAGAAGSGGSGVSGSAGSLGGASGALAQGGEVVVAGSAGTGQGGEAPQTGGSGDGGSQAGAGPQGGSSGAPTCEPAVEVPGTQVVYDLAAAQAASSESLGFFDYPWPELSRPLTELAGFPNPSSAVGCAASTSVPTLQLLVDAVDPIAYRQYLSELTARFKTEGPNGAQIVMRFDGAVQSVLPTALESVNGSTSPILLVNVDPQEPARGRVIPILSRVFLQSRYLQPNTLSILPHPGFALEQGRLYAAVVKRTLADAAGAPLGSPQSFEEKKQLGDCAPDPTYRAAFDQLEQLGVPRQDIAMMSVFRAGNPTASLDARIDEIDAMDNPGELAGFEVTEATLDEAGGFYLVRGSFETLIVQRGTPPYLPEIGLSIGLAGVNVEMPLDPTSEEGRWLEGSLPSAAGGTDIAAPRTERIEFRLSVPASLATGDPPEGGVPVVVYGPGTGGTLDGPYTSGAAAALATQGIAVFTTTPVMHAGRAHSENLDAELRSQLQLIDSMAGLETEAELVGTVESGDLFFNPINLQAAKGNSLQAAVDYAWQARLLADIVLPVTLGATEREIRFNPQRIAFYGHSQGAATGPLLASSSFVAAQVLSAPAGHLPSNILGKTEPSDGLNIASMLDYLICEEPAEPVDVHHPVLNLLLHWLEEVDAVNYAPYLIRQATGTPQHVFLLAGTEDHYVAPASHDAVISAARLQQLSPVLVPSAGLGLLTALEPTGGYDAAYETLSSNLSSGTATATGAFRQYHDATCVDDHFVATCTAQGLSDWGRFLGTFALSGTPTVP